MCQGSYLCTLNFRWRYLGFSLLAAVSVSTLFSPLGSVTSYRDGLVDNHTAWRQYSWAAEYNVYIVHCPWFSLWNSASLRVQLGRIGPICQMATMSSPLTQKRTPCLLSLHTTYAQCRVPVSTLFAPRKSLLHMESVNCLDLLKIFSHNRKNRTGKKTPYNPSPHCYGRGERP